jgi:hypothetical protein
MQCWTAYYVKKGGFECPICHCKVPSTSLNEQQVEQQQTQQPFYNAITPEKSLLVLALLCLICAIIILIIRLM